MTGGVKSANVGALAYAPASVVNNGAGQASPGYARTNANSAQMNLFTGWNDAAWTASGAKYASFTITYPI